jgi:hypothetical protein
MDAEGIQENTGTTKIIIRDGVFAFVQTADHALGAPITTGEYRGSGDHVIFKSLRPLFNEIETPSIRWSFDGQKLHLEFENCGHLDEIEPHLCEGIRVLYETHPWTKIG